MARYIDADKLNKKKKFSFQTQGEPFPKSEWFIKADDLFSAPTEDVVEVVRCKDCKHWGGTTFGFVCRKFSGIETKICMGADHFCSYGENALSERKMRGNESISSL